jgi:hypothetical protein
MLRHVSELAVAEMTSVNGDDGRLYFGSIGTAAIGCAPEPYILLTPGREECHQT